MSCGFFRFSFLGFWDWRVGDVEEAFGSGRCILGGSFARGLRFFWGLLLVDVYQPYAMFQFF